MNPVAKTCEYCKKLFTRRVYEGKKGHESMDKWKDRRFCGVPCYRAHAREERAGKIGSLEHFAGWR